MATYLTGNGRATERVFFLLAMPDSGWFKKALMGALTSLMYDGNWVENGDQTTHEAHDIAGELLDGLIVLNVNPFPEGKIEMFAGTTIPDGWLLCDGALYAEIDYPELFDAIGTTWGGGSGNFNVPDLRDRVSVGSGSTYAMADTGGEAQHTLTTSELPSHNHSASGTAVSDIGHTHTEITAVPAVGSIAAGVPFPYALPGVGVTGISNANLVVTDPTIGNEGGDMPHNNMQPFAALNFIIWAGR